MALVVAAVIAAQLVLYLMPTTIVPPARPAEPAAVFLVDYGRTPSLVLPAGENRMVAYVYGDWRYYALRQQGVYASLAAVLWPTQGALGRAEIAGPPTAETVRAGMGAGIQQLYRFDVERKAVLRLRASLDRLYRERASTAVTSYGMTFVQHPRAYTYWSNSNHITADWLAALGCDIRGPAFSSRWRISKVRENWIA